MKYERVILDRDNVSILVGGKEYVRLYRDYEDNFTFTRFYDEDEHSVLKFESCGCFLFWYFDEFLKDELTDRYKDRLDWLLTRHEKVREHVFGKKISIDQYIGGRMI